MSLIYLGLVNALRNLNRSLMTVLAMALAAAVMTCSMTLTQGYTPQRASVYRAYLGGDVLVYPDWTWPTQADVAALGPGEARLAALPGSFGSPLQIFHPDYYSSGYLTAAGGGAPRWSMFSSPAELQSVLATAVLDPEVVGARAYVAAPVIGGSLAVTVSGGEGTVVSLDGSFLRECPAGLVVGDGRLVPADAGGIRLVSGRWLAESDADAGGRTAGATGAEATAGDGAIPVVVNLRAVLAHDAVITGASVDLGPLGQEVTALVPRIKDGPRPYFDYTDPVEVRLRVVGVYEVPTRVYHWSVSRVDHYEPLYLETPDILAPAGALAEVLEAAGLGPGEVAPVGALTLELANQGTAEVAAARLRQALPGFSVVTVAREAGQANSAGLPERFYDCPPTYQPKTRDPGQPVIPAERGELFGLLMFGFAGLVAAANGTLLVLSRRTEFAILKAIGLRGFEVATVVMVEVLTLSIIGLLLGFGVSELMALPGFLLNNIGSGAIARAILGHLSVVGPATLGFSLVFALFPVFKTVRITVAEALRGQE